MVTDKTIKQNDITKEKMNCKAFVSMKLQGRDASTYYKSRCLVMAKSP